MGVYIDRMAAAAMAASTLGRGLLAQPGTGQRQRQLKLAQAGRAAEQPSVSALEQQAFKLGLQPGC